MSAPRLFVIMGSGETAPTMVTPHREVVARFGAAPLRAVLLDTPYGFQENAAEISQRAAEYFAQRVQLSIEVAGFPGPLAADPRDRSAKPSAAVLARLRAADLIFSGPGSPTYALSTWRGSSVPEALADKLERGGAVVFASAAAVTIGRFSLPVYEIYKVGQPIHWLDGLDLLAPLGFGRNAVVVPHFDNAEGGTHDTRFCYMGERRLAALEELLPDDAWILGIDEHTALMIDLDAQEASVMGRGVLTVRRRGVAERFAAGTRLPISAIAAAARGARRAEAAASSPDAAPRDTGAGAASPPRAGTHPERSPLLGEVARLEQAFAEALASRRAAEAAEAILALDRTIVDWSADSLQTDDPDRARAVLHSLVHRLGEAASVGLRDPREPLAPLVERLIALRAEMRADRAFVLADRLRDRLVAAGIELHDTPQGTTWNLRA
jgi:cyanophycinase-like exopeptidase